MYCPEGGEWMGTTHRIILWCVAGEVDEKVLGNGGREGRKAPGKERSPGRRWPWLCRADAAVPAGRAALGFVIGHRRRASHSGLFVVVSLMVSYSSRGWKGCKGQGKTGQTFRRAERQKGITAKQISPWAAVQKHSRGLRESWMGRFKLEARQHFLLGAQTIYIPAAAVNRPG